MMRLRSRKSFGEGAIGDSQQVMEDLAEGVEKIKFEGGEYEALADGEYDAIVLGTGLTECVISGILSVNNMKVLHADKNDYYGGQSASVNLEQMFQKFDKNPQDIDQGVYGRPREYNIDLIPKFIIGNGNLVRLLLHCDVAKYLDFKVVDGSFVYSGKRPHKVPVTPREAITSGLLGPLEKNRCRQFFSFVNSYDPAKPEIGDERSCKMMPMKDLFKYYGLQPDTIEFIGHALALYTDDTYLEKMAEEVILRIQLYANSLLRYTKSPYLYPLYGLGELPQAFARLSAVHGGTFMLHTPIDEVLYDSSGKVFGIKSQGKVATCKYLVGAPEYFPEKTKSVAKVVRCYCILSEPPPNTRDSASCQIIVPAAQAKRQNDIYILVVSGDHKVCPEGRYLALVSTLAESDHPEDEVSFGVSLLGNILQKFISVDDVMVPESDGKSDNVYLSRAYDPTTHFQTTSEDVFDLYKRIFDEDLEINTSNANHDQ